MNAKVRMVIFAAIALLPGLLKLPVFVALKNACRAVRGVHLRLA